MLPEDILKYYCKVCHWSGSFDELFSKPYDDEYFAYCPRCKEPEPEQGGEKE